MRTRFATDDHPVNARQISPSERTDERLAGKEAHRGGNLSEIVNTIQNAAVFDADSHPNIIWPQQLRAKLPNPGASLRQNLKRVLRALGHRMEDAPNEFERHVEVKQIAH